MIDENLTPSLENTIVVLWLQLIHPGLPLLVKQKYGSELRNKTLASLKPEISQALRSLLDELRSIEDTKSLCIASSSPRRSFPGSSQTRRRPPLSCILCKTAGRPHTSHDLMHCRFLPDRGKPSWSRTRLVQEAPDDLPYDTDDFDTPDSFACPDVPAPHSDQPIASRVSIIQSPVWHVEHLLPRAPHTADFGHRRHFQHAPRFVR